MSNKPLLVEESDIARAWAKVMLTLLEPGVEELSPVVVRLYFNEDGPTEDSAILSIVEAELARYEREPTRTNASTIFPESLWVPERGHAAMVQRYMKILPKLKKLHPMNRRGMYFERLVSYGPNRVDQLEHILDTWQKGNHRRSELQATLFDPSLDHSDQPLKGFPCLQHVTFNHDKKGLTVIGYYGVQYIFDRAYGNYLGLCRLGRYMAHYMDVPFVGLVCVSGIAKRGKPEKIDLAGFGAELRSCLTVIEGRSVARPVASNPTHPALQGGLFSQVGGT